MTCALCAEERTRNSFPRELENQYGLPACWDCREEECGGCTRKLQRREFAPEELVKRRDKRRCRDCVELRALRECSKCHAMKPKEEYSAKQLAEEGKRRVCNDCQQGERHLKCSKCSAMKPKEEYSANQLAKEGEERVCSACLFRLRCSRCKAQKPRPAYTPADRKSAPGPSPPPSP